VKVLFIGDIFGEPGRRVLAKAVPRLVAQRQIDIVIGNGENAAGGFGITPELAEELFDLGLAVITTGNHAWDKKEILDYFPREPRLLRPANYPGGVPGHGSVVVESASGEKLGVLQLMGRAYMPTLDCPFQVAKKEMADLKKCCLIVTSGGTGPALRDVTPEATGAVCTKMLPGFGELMRMESLKYVPTAILSRQVAGIRNQTLIVNLPGKPKAIRQCLDAVFPAIPYCIDLIGGPFLECNESVIKAFRPV